MDHFKYRGDLKHVGRILRKNMTGAEVRLWSRIRRKQILNQRFYRQKPIGRYVLDFYCPAKKLVVEVDGRQHNKEGGIQDDYVRDRYLTMKLGLKVLRFRNEQVLTNIDNVIFEIEEAINR